MDRRSFIRSSLALGAVPVLSPSASAVATSDVPGEPVLEAPSETSIGIVWAVPGLSIGFVELADNSEMRNAVLVRDAVPVAMLDDQSLSVRLTGLKPATRYWYRTVTRRIISRDNPLYADIRPGETIRGRIHSFETCGVGARSSFAVINDTHADWKSFSLTAAHLKRTGVPVVVWNGDATNCTESKRTAVDVFLRPSVSDADYAAETAVLWVNGNHDFEGKWARHLGEVMLERPLEERTARDAALTRNFAIRQGDIALIGLDTGEALSDDDSRLAGRGNFADYRRRQTVWLEDQFRRSEIATAPFVVVFCHIPLFEERPGAVERDLTHALKGGCNAWCRPGYEMWGRILTEHGVRLVVSGHEHQYRMDRAKDGRSWDQLVGGGPELGIPSRSDGDTYFPTVIEGCVRDGKLRVEVWDVWHRRSVGTFEYQRRNREC